MGCQHQGLQISRDYLQKVLQEESVVSVGVIRGLYEDARYVVSLPVFQRGTGNPLGIVTISSPTASTEAVVNQMFSYFLWVALAVTVLSVLLLAVFVRQQNNPLRAVARAARDFGHGDLTVRVKTGGKLRRTKKIPKNRLFFVL